MFEDGHPRRYISLFVFRPGAPYQKGRGKCGGPISPEFAGAESGVTCGLLFPLLYSGYCVHLLENALLKCTIVARYVIHSIPDQSTTSYIHTLTHTEHFIGVTLLSGLPFVIQTSKFTTN